MRFAHRSLPLLLSSYTTSAWVNLSKTARFRPLSRSTRQMSSNANSSTDHLRVALCQFPVTENKSKNHQTAAEYLKKAADQGAELVVLPEIWNSPYATSAFPEYAESLPNLGDAGDSIQSDSAQLLHSFAKDHKVWVVGGSIPEVEDEGIFNTCLVFDPEGNIVAKHRKVHLFDIDVPGGITFFESDTLSPGDTISHFATPWGNIGVGICYDIRFPEYAMLLSKEKECSILIYPGAFNLTTGPAHWELLQRARAVDNQCFVLTASPARSPEPSPPGKYPHYSAWGHSTAVSPWGEVVATTDERPGIVMANLDISKVQEMRTSIPVAKQKRSDLYKLERS